MIGHSLASRERGMLTFGKHCLSSPAKVEFPLQLVRTTPASIPLGNEWPLRRLLLWSLLTLAAIVFTGPGNLRAFLSTKSNLVDFHQEWISAKFYLDGLPVYSRIEEGMLRYQKLRRPPGGGPFLDYNAHPPTSVLIAIPFGHFDYGTAGVVWNVFSIALLIPVIRTILVQLEIPFHPGMLLRILTLLLICEPLYQQIFYGQLNLILLWLIVAAWSAERSNRPISAGFFLGTATVLKLFPALLFLHFLISGRWRLLAAGGVTILGWTALTAALVGTDAYREYFAVVVPHLSEYKTRWFNLSIHGFWARLFDGPSEFGKSFPIAYAPWLATALTAFCDAIILIVLLVLERRSNTREQRDLSFSLCLVAALLLSPLTWAHYVVLLFLPLVLLWRNARNESNAYRVAFAIWVALLWIPAGLFWMLAIPELRKLPWWQATAHPWQVLTAISLQFYALVGVFVLGAIAALRAIRRSKSTGPAPIHSEVPP